MRGLGLAVAFVVGFVPMTGWSQSSQTEEVSWGGDTRAAKTPEECAKLPYCELGSRCDLRCPSRISVLGVRIGMPVKQAVALLKKRAKRVNETKSNLLVLVTAAQVESWKLVEDAGILMGHNPGIRYEIRDEAVSLISVGDENVSQKTLEQINIEILKRPPAYYVLFQREPVATIQTKTTYLSGRTAVTNERPLLQLRKTYFVPDLPLFVVEYSFNGEDLGGFELQLTSEADWPDMLARLKARVGPFYQTEKHSYASRKACEESRQEELARRQKAAEDASRRACESGTGNLEWVRAERERCLARQASFQCGEWESRIQQAETQLTSCLSQRPVLPPANVDECQEVWRNRVEVAPQSDLRPAVYGRKALK